jgi:predicted helicase
MAGDPLSIYFADLQGEYSKGVATEHSYRPALKTLLESLEADKEREVTNEPKRIACGAPDYLIARRTSSATYTVGHVEAKDVGVGLDRIERDSDRVEPGTKEGQQFKRYREALPNLILTDYLEFRHYVDGKLRETARLATPGPGGKLAKDDAGEMRVRELLTYFLTRQPEHITRAEDLARRMAYLTRLIRNRIVLDFEEDTASPMLRRWRETLARVLIADLNQPQKKDEFADMFAQTLAYGLFSARTMDVTPGDFTRREAQELIPATNPFLRDFFYDITGHKLKDEAFAGFVDDLAALLANTDMDAVLSTFGKRTRQEDPVIHFYETFLAAYDPKLREARGVYYTPEPVVQYIVRSVDHLLKTRFGLRDGLADRSKIQVENHDPNLRVQGSREMRKTRDVHRVLVLDPACGTGTFLYAAVDLIRQRFMDRGDAGDWSDYVRLHLLPRIFGFELLMAPYAVAHFKLGLQLAGRDLPEEQRVQWAYDFSADERLRVYLTNTLEEAHEYGNLPLFVEGVARESIEANEVKRDLPIMVVMGNPPYSGHSTNTGEWISGLLRGRDSQTNQPTGNYFEVDGAPLGERNPKWLNDDYVKFIRFAQWRIEQTGAGILAFISNNGYLDNPTFRGMRQSLMQTFTDIYLLDLHGNSKKKETAPDGSKDENVFDIQQGVAIGLFVKERGKQGRATVHHADLWGTRETKYRTLLEEYCLTTQWTETKPVLPFYLFVPQNVSIREEYESNWSVNDILPVHTVGVVTGQDSKTIAMTRTEAEDLANQLGIPVSEVTPILYRPFDIRYIVYNATVVTRPRLQVMRHMLTDSNLALISARSNKSENPDHFLCCRFLVETKCGEATTQSATFPLYLYPNTKQTAFDTGEAGGKGGRRHNLNPAFIAAFEKALGLTFVPDGKGTHNGVFGPEDVFHYMYAVFHSPTYRQRYAEFLKIDFPRLPLTSYGFLFRTLCELGERLVALHLMEAEGTGPVPSYPVKGDNRVEGVRYSEVHRENVYRHVERVDTEGQVWINKTQYFDGVPPRVWEFHIGGYQVAEKWLKDRKGRVLTYDDREHYKRIIAALGETASIMQRIDKEIQDWPIVLRYARPGRPAGNGGDGQPN